MMFSRGRTDGVAAACEVVGDGLARDTIGPDHRGDRVPVLAMAVEGAWRTYSLSLAWSGHDDMLKLVGSFEMDPPDFDGRPLAVLYCGDDDAAKATVATLIAEIGCDPVDTGELKYSRLLEASACLVIKFLFAGRDPRTIFNFIQPETKSVR